MSNIDWASFVKTLRTEKLPERLETSWVSQPHFASMLDETAKKHFGINVKYSIYTIQKWEYGKVIPNQLSQMILHKLDESVGRKARAKSG